MKLPTLASLAALAATVVGGCAIGPEHPRHAPLLQSAALGLSGTEATAIDAQWWQAYADPALDALVARALQDNPTLVDALARLRAAEAASDVAGGALKPQLRGDVDEQRSHLSDRSFYPPPFGGRSYWEGKADLALSWHLDFWGRQHDRLAAAGHEARARAIAVRGARLAIETAVVAEYLELDRAHTLRDLTHEAAEARARLLAIASARTHAGLETDIETRAARAAADDARVEERDAAMHIALAAHRLAALTGQGPAAYGSIARPRLAPGGTPPLPTTLPADLLLRRGDVGIALERVRELGALEHATRAAAYPDVNLRAFAGLTAFGLRELLSAPARTMGGGIALGLPIYDGGRLRAQLRGANAAVEQAVANYNDTALRAVRECADQLATIDTLTADATNLRQRVEALDGTARLATERRDAGLANDAPALEARLRAISARRALAVLDTAGQLARVALIAALGGSAEDPPASVPNLAKGAP